MSWKHMQVVYSKLATPIFTHTQLRHTLLPLFLVFLLGNESGSFERLILIIF